MTHRTTSKRNAAIFDAEVEKLIRSATRACPISIVEICCKTLLDERAVKAAVERLRAANVPVGASRQKPNGYFMCRTSEDVKISVRPMVLQAVAMIRAARSLAPAHVIREMLGQTLLELEEKN